MAPQRNFVKTIMMPAPEAPADTAATPRAPAPSTVTLTLSDSILVSLAARPDIRAEFPFLQPVQQAAGKTCCGAAKAARVAFQNQVDKMKDSLRSLSTEQKARFKALLGVGRIALYLAGTRVEF